MNAGYVIIEFKTIQQNKTASVIWDLPPCGSEPIPICTDLDRAERIAEDHTMKTGNKCAVAKLLFGFSAGRPCRTDLLDLVGRDI